jgi:DNA polymerase III delta prime subunit
MVYTLSPTPFAQKTWDQGRHRPSRDISTVIMPPEQKEHLLQDVKEYLNPYTMRWYAQRGLPYRRGYLFYGPPGTGKTSLSLALAGELKLPLYILSLSTGSLTDETLTMLFVGLPRKCIVLLEDIDCAGVHRSGGNTDGYDSDSSDDDSEDDEDDESSDHGKGGKTSGKSGAKTNGVATGPSSKSSSTKAGTSGNRSGNTNMNAAQPRRPRISVSFSGLLNAIDGVASHEGRILIMTTNHRERLDSALIRPGRVDVQIEFGYAAKETLSEIFRELYKEIGGRSSISLASGGKLFDKKQQNPEPAEKERVRQLADSFSERIPANRFTPAEIQGYLMSYKGQPEKALSNIDKWVLEKTKVEREKKAKADRKKRKEKEKKSAISEYEKEENVTSLVTMNGTVSPMATNGNGVSNHPSDNIASRAPDALTHSLATFANSGNAESLLQALLQILAQSKPPTSGENNSNTGLPLQNVHSNGVAIAGFSGGTNGYASCGYTDDNIKTTGKTAKEEAWERERLNGGGVTLNGVNGVSDVSGVHTVNGVNGVGGMGKKVNGTKMSNGATREGGCRCDGGGG